ncbi:MAG: ATPase domain-containing protein [archaeon]|jgi:circadian clock protein KaiC
MVKRIATGIYSANKKLSLDASIGGGIPEGNIVLVTGASGTGKSTLCYQVIAEQAKQGKICYYVAFDQIKKDVIDNAKCSGIDLNKSNIFIQTYEELQGFVIDELINLLSKSKIDFVVFDSLASITGVLPEEEFSKISQAKIAENYMPLMVSETRVIRRSIRRIILALKKHGITTLLINELPEGTKKLSKDDESDFLADGIIVMNYVEIGVTDYRSMTIRKMRKTSHEKDLIPFNITNKGIQLAEKV